ncbi:MAG: FixH family protein [Bacteroidia bacterium]|nr:FixH family protein [Bacteroidia bacterium]
MNITWGHKITIAFIAFASFILYMVYQMVNSEVDIVEKDYYAKELKFQHQIDKYHNTLQLGDSAVIINQDEKNMEIIFKNSYPQKITVYLYYPVNEKYDRMFHFKKQSDIIIDKSNIQKGKCKLKMEWNDNDKEYYFEKEMMIY